jgi:hypothetical protein
MLIFNILSGVVVIGNFVVCDATFDAVVVVVVPVIVDIVVLMLLQF